MRDRGWIWAQFVIAGVLLVLSLIGIIGTAVFDAAELTFSFGGAIQAFFVFPGTVLSLVVNAIIMRGRPAGGLHTAEKVLLGIQFAMIAVLVGLHFWNDGLGIAIALWPIHILLAIAICVTAAVRTGAARRAATDPYVAPPPPPVAPPPPPPVTSPNAG